MLISDSGSSRTDRQNAAIPGSASFNAILDTFPENKSSSAAPAHPAKGSAYVPPRHLFFSSISDRNGTRARFPPGYRSGLTGFFITLVDYDAFFLCSARLNPHHWRILPDNDVCEE